MSNLPISLCKYDYPVELLNTIKDVVVCARRHYGNDIVSFLLCGSTATGDFVYKRDNSNTLLLSDIDALMIVNRLDDRVSEFNRDIRNIYANNRSASKLFYIDISVIDNIRLWFIQKTYQNVEMRTSSIVLDGKDIRDKMPQYWNKKHSRQTFLLNLWRSVLYCPTSGPYSPSKNDIYDFSLSRVWLDLPILVASEKGLCIPGHNSRVRWFLDNHNDLMVSEEITETIQHSIDVRKGKIIADRNKLLKRLPVLIEYAMKIMGVNESIYNINPTLYKSIKKAIGNRGLRRIISEARICNGDMIWLLKRKEAVIACILIELNIRLAENNTSLPSPYIQKLLGILDKRNTLDIKTCTQIREWKKMLWRGMLRLYPSLLKHNERIINIMED